MNTMNTRQQEPRHSTHAAAKVRCGYGVPPVATPRFSLTFRLAAVVVALAILTSAHAQEPAGVSAADKERAAQILFEGAPFLPAKETGTVNPYDPQTFANPPGEYRPLQIVHGFDRYMRSPETLEGEEGIDERLKLLTELGIGGVVANVGFKDYLLSPRQWDIYRYGMRKAAGLGMILWLYDENAYPSGSAGGVVTRANPEYAAQGLACYTLPAAAGEEVVFDLPLSCKRFEAAYAYPAGATPCVENGVDLAPHVDEWSALRWTPPEGQWTVYYFARRVMFEGTFVTAVPHGPTRMYIDLLNPSAVKAFLRVTHQQYLRQTPPDIWKQIRAIFTDEPLMNASYFGTLPSERDGKQYVLDQPLFLDRPPAAPWTDSFAQRFQAAKGYDLRPFFYALFTGDSPEACYARQDHWDVASRLYSEAFFQQIADWCAANGVASSGHLLAEENLWGHMRYHGSLFRAIRPMQLPGIDILTGDPRHIGEGVFMAAKAVSSVAHLTGRDTIHCEASGGQKGVTDPEGRLAVLRAQGNMLFVMGINQLTLYHNWGEVGQEGYRKYNDYMGRLALLLRGGRHVCDAAVLYPIRGGWAWWTPSGENSELATANKTLGQRFSALANVYGQVCRRLAHQQIDFDILDEEAVQEAAVAGGALQTAGEAYRALVLPAACALELATLQALERFCTAGGTLLCIGEAPTFADSPKNQPAFDALMARLPLIRVSLEDLPGAMRERVGTDFQLPEPVEHVFYLHRRREGRDIYFIVNNRPEPVTLQPKLRAPGPFNLYRPLTGDCADAPPGLRLELGAYEGLFLVGTETQ